MILRILSLASLAVGVHPAGAIAQNPQGFAWYQNDKTAPNEPHRASRNGFGAMILVTPDADGFWKAWAEPTPPNVTVTDTIRLGGTVQVMLLFSGCKAKTDGKCDVAVTFAMTDPDGKPYSDPATAVAWSGPPAPSYNLQLSPASLRFRFEPEDQAGTYRIRAEVTDKVANVTLSLETSVTGIK